MRVPNYTAPVFISAGKAIDSVYFLLLLDLINKQVAIVNP